MKIINANSLFIVLLLSLFNFNNLGYCQSNLFCDYGLKINTIKGIKDTIYVSIENSEFNKMLIDTSRITKDAIALTFLICEKIGIPISRPNIERFIQQPSFAKTVTKYHQDLVQILQWKIDFSKGHTIKYYAKFYSALRNMLISQIFNMSANDVAYNNQIEITLQGISGFELCFLKE
jgi:hypothetical protein